MTDEEYRREARPTWSCEGPSCTRESSDEPDATRRSGPGPVGRGVRGLVRLDRGGSRGVARHGLLARRRGSGLLGRLGGEVMGLRKRDSPGSAGRVGKMDDAGKRAYDAGKEGPCPSGKRGRRRACRRRA